MIAEAHGTKTGLPDCWLARPWMLHLQSLLMENLKHRTNFEIHSSEWKRCQHAINFRNVRWKNPKFFRPFNYGSSTRQAGGKLVAKLANEIANSGPISFHPFVRPSVRQSVSHSRRYGKTGKFSTFPPFHALTLLLCKKKTARWIDRARWKELKVLREHKKFAPYSSCCKVFQWKKNKRSGGRSVEALRCSWIG